MADRIVQRGPEDDRRAALVDGPDVWEVQRRFEDLPGVLEDRLATLMAESNLTRPQIFAALGYAAVHQSEIRARIRLAEKAEHAAALDEEPLPEIPDIDDRLMEALNDRDFRLRALLLSDKAGELDEVDREVAAISDEEIEQRLRETLERDGYDSSGEQ